MESERRFLCVVLIIGLVMTVGGIGYALTSTTTEYHYEVKAEQVNQNEMVNDSVNYDDLSEAEQEMLYRAFKKSDHFLGGAEARVVTEEPVEGIETGTWKVIRVQGVPMLIAISGPDKIDDVTPGGFVAMIFSFFGMMILIWFGPELIE